MVLLYMTTVELVCCDDTVVCIIVPSVSHPVWHCRVHSYGLFALLLYDQVHVVVLQDGDHLYLHGSPHTHAPPRAGHFRCRERERESQGFNESGA